jgi:hypothetical protein
MRRDRWATRRIGPDAPLVRCHHAAYSIAQDGYHLLLDDVGATHVEMTGCPPTLDCALALADGLATMHARWWGADGWPPLAGRSTTRPT